MSQWTAVQEQFGFQCNWNVFMLTQLTFSESVFKGNIHKMYELFY
jgi:hypothetical protein